MGLDMYFYKREYISHYDFSKNPTRASEIEVICKTKFEDGDIKEEHFSTKNGCVFVELEIAYWRKANAIHKYFIDTCAKGVDECQNIYVEYSDVQELIKLCKEVLEDHSKAQELLPTTDGFFFGSTEYDEWYFEDLKNTIEQLKDCKPNEEYIYRASW